jgi:alanyl-tRNA synthetase
MILDEIKKSEAELDKTIVWSFWEKYPEIVKVYTVKDSDWNIYSRELCWWPHITSTSTMWKFRIIKEESSSAGVRRIKAVLEK